MQVYKTKVKRLTGSNFHEVNKRAFSFYEKIRKKTKRRPYIRSAYFNKDKIFLDLYWHHLHEKMSLNDKTRRVKYFPCAVELIQKSRFEPTSKENPNKRSEILHRFAGITENKDLFFVQIKEDKKSGKRWLISTFPIEKWT